MGWGRGDRNPHPSKPGLGGAPEHWRMVGWATRLKPPRCPPTGLARKLVLHVNAMKTNITLKVDAELIREARILAAEQGSSISALLAAQLEKAVRERKDYAQAKRRALALLRKGFDWNYKPPSSRDRLHER